MALFASLLLVAAVPCGAQSPASATTDKSAASSAAPASSTATSSATAAPAAGTDSTAAASKPAGSETKASEEPSPELVKQARQEGFKPKKRNGVTQFCQTSAQMNTHFLSETCVDEAHLKMLVEQREDQRNQMRQSSACTGASCNAH
jgi:flagellar motor protein MotB